MSGLWYRLVLDQKGSKQEARTAFWLRHSRGRIRQLRVTTSKSFHECINRLESGASAYLEEIEFDFPPSESFPPFFRFKADPVSFSWRILGYQHTTARRLPFEPKVGPYRISELKIYGVELYWQIEAQQLENLTTLIVDNSHLLVSDLLVILEHSPDIHTLEVQTSYESTIPERKERLILTRLKTLKLLASSAILRFIGVPALQILQFSDVHLGKAIQDLHPPHPSLVSLSVLQCFSAQDVSLPLPDTLQTLRLMSLAYDVNGVVDSLASGKCPGITELDLSSTAIGSGPIIRLIKARNCLPMKEEGDETVPTKIELLTMDRCDGISSESLPWIRSKVARVSCVYESKRSTKRQRIK